MEKDEPTVTVSSTGGLGMAGQGEGGGCSWPQQTRNGLLHLAMACLPFPPVPFYPLPLLRQKGMLGRSFKLRLPLHPFPSFLTAV